MNKFKYDTLHLPSSHKVRLAQAILQYSPGAMVDFPDRTLLTAAPYTWHSSLGTDEKIRSICDPRFARALHVDGFEAPTQMNYVQFPEWYFCPVCRRFQPITSWQAEAERNAKGGDNPYRQMRSRAAIKRSWQQDNQERKAFLPRCSNHDCHNSELIPARIVVACEHGHLDDFPWVKWVHYRNIGGAKEPCCESPVLLFESGGGTETGEDIRITCTKCHAVATLKGVFTADAFQKVNEDLGREIFYCSGRLPDFGSHSDCNQMPRALLRGATSVHFPMVRSSMVIPSQTGSPEVDIDDLAYRWEEYQALCNEQYGKPGDEFTRVDSGSLSDYERLGSLHLQQVELLDQVRIVRAFLGYSRLRPAARRDDEGFIHARLPQDKTYPAYEGFGEGIFLRFDEEAIKEWLEMTPRAAERAWLVEQNRQKGFFAGESHAPITPKFLLLHTLAHLLIKELSFECGYNIAGLNERIYCADRKVNNTDFDMAGIFIYVAGGDAEGTLGGLIRQGRADTLPQIFQRALAKARSCSNDPMCSGSHGQGQDGQNLASCYACALLPETSCEEFNSFLDRGVVVGTFDEPEIGFYSKVAFKRTRHVCSNMAKTQVTECVNVEEKSATEGWEAKRGELLEDEAIEAAKLMEKAGVPVPDIIGAELLNGRCNVEMIWQKQKIVYLTSEQMDQASELRKEGWQILDIGQPVDAGMFEL